MQKIDESKVISIYVAALLGLYPLYTTANGYASMMDAKLLCFWKLTICLLLCFGIVKWIRQEKRLNQSLHNRTHERVVIILLIALCISLVITMLSSGSSVETLLSERGIAWHLVYFVIFLLSWHYGEWSEAYIWAGALAAAANAILISIQLQGYNPLWLYPNGLTYYDANYSYSGEYLGTIGNSDIFCIWLIIVAALCAGTLIGENKTSLRVAAIIGLLSSSYCGAATGTAAFLISAGMLAILLGFFLVSTLQKFIRWVSVSILGVSAYIAGYIARNIYTASLSYKLYLLPILLFFLGLSIFCISNCKNALPGIFMHCSVRRSRIAWVLLSTCVVMIICCGIYFIEPTGETGMHYELHSILHGDLKAEFGSSRLLIWQECISAIKVRPLFGSGEPFTDYIQIVFERTTEAGVTLTTIVRDAHNILLSWLVHNGVVGTCLVSALLIIVLWSGIRYGTEQALIYCAAICAYVIIEATCLGGYFTDPIFWCLAGLVLGECCCTTSGNKCAKIA